MCFFHVIAFFLVTSYPIIPGVLDNEVWSCICMPTEILTGKTSRDDHIFPLRMNVDDEIFIWCHLSSRKQIRSLLISKRVSCSDHCGNYRQ